MPDGTLDMDALLSASVAAQFAGVTTAAVCNWAARGILPVATDEQGREIRDERGRARYRLIDVAKAEARTAARAQQMAARITRRSPSGVAA
jgi:hypothetical protein